MYLSGGKFKMFIFKRDLFVDPTGTGIINLRFLKRLFEIVECTTLTGDDRKKVENLLILVAKKLAITWTHYDRYAKAEDLLIEEVKKAETMNENIEVKEIKFSQDLFFDFDGFLVQLKSTLDYIVKMPTLILGERIWTLRTFGDKGQDVINFLSRNMPKEYRGTAKLIIENVINHHLDWLRYTIECRDKINHFIYGGISFEYFFVDKFIEDGKEIIRVPMWTDIVSVRQSMYDNWMNLFSLSEQFLFNFLAIKKKEGLNFAYNPSKPYSLESPLILMNDEQFAEATKGLKLEYLNETVAKEAEERRKQGEQNRIKAEAMRAQNPKKKK